MRLELIGKKGNIPFLGVWFRPFGVYLRTTSKRVAFGPRFGLVINERV